MGLSFFFTKNTDFIRGGIHNSINIIELKDIILFLF